MSENNNIQLIIRAIDTSIDFDGLMDRIDFDSYLSEEMEDIIKSQRYQNYIKDIANAFKYCNIITNSIEKRIKDNNFIPNYSHEDDFTKYLINQLYSAKNTRISSRQNLIREKEEDYYLLGNKRLNNAYNLIPIKPSIKKDEKTGLLNNFDWAKVLYLNELAIYNSGLAKSSMSLGFAVESIKVLEDIYPKLKNIENLSGSNINDNIDFFENCVSDNALITPSQIIKLYTFALICKGEAEKLLYEIDASLKTFQRIINISEKCRKKRKDYLISQSDYFVAILRKAQIYIDQGRGKEAIAYLDSLNQLDTKDCRFQERDLEKASALIDRKDYIDAYTLLQDYKKDDWVNTFANRKARVYILHLLNEYKANRPIDFEKEISEETPLSIEYKNYIDTAKELIKEAWERKDRDSFKGACDKLAVFYEPNKDNLEKSLKCYYLHLLENDNLLGNDIEIIKEWLGDKKLIDLLQQYPKKFLTFIEKECNRGNDSFLEKFYSFYLEYFTYFKIEKQDIPFDFIEKIKNSLVDIYYQKDKDIELGKIEIKYEKFIESKKNPNIKKGIPERFITDAFFKNHINDHKPEHSGMHIESITTRMRLNTMEYVKKVVGKSKMQTNNGQIRNTLTVLRRWNSFTPTLSSSINKSKGGGYFLRFSQKDSSVGIVIDPGYDYLENFFSQGYKIRDIDLILVSHNHPDHTGDLAALLSLIHELNGRLGKYLTKNEVNKKNPILVLSHGVFEHYRSIIHSSEKELKDIIVIDQKENIIPVYDNNSGITIQAFSTAHQDLSQFQSFGFIISATINDQKAIIGYTGDIKWRQNDSMPPKYIEYFKNCNIVCAHIGSIINIMKEKDFCSTFCENYINPNKNLNCLNYCTCRDKNFNKLKVTRAKLIEQTRDENHLYLAGISLFFNYLLNKKKSRLKLAIFSEFGEELKYGLRLDLYKKFNGWFKGIRKNLNCLPGDIGLEVDVFTNEVLCHCCKRFTKSSDIKPVPYGKEEAICFVCKECEEVLSTYQIDKMLKDYCENGRQIESEN